MVTFSVNGWKVNLLIDRIVMLLTISALDFNSIRNQFYLMRREGRVVYVHDRFMDYMHVTRIKVRLRKSRGITITAYTSYGRHRTSGVKFDWSPRNVGSETYEKFSQTINEITPAGIHGLLHDGAVRYIEVALDVAGADVHDYVMTYPRFSRSHLFYSAIDDSQTTYLGTRNSRTSYACYDKKKELRNRHAFIKRKNLLRLEYRNRDRQTLTGFHSLPNPFSSLLIADVYLARVLDSGPEWQRFIDQCEDQGAHRALNYYSQHRKRRFRERLALANAPWLDAIATWERWPRVVGDFMAQHRGEFQGIQQQYLW